MATGLTDDGEKVVEKVMKESLIKMCQSEDIKYAISVCLSVYLSFFLSFFLSLFLLLSISLALNL